MNKKLLLLPVVMMFITAGCSLANAQVKIGGNPETGITSGVLLELGDATSTSGGLLLPRVVLTAENANPFGDGESMDLPAGLLVYNLGSETEGEALDEGLYVLKGGLWVQAGSGGSDTPLMNVAITPNTPVTLYSTGNSKQLNPAISIADSTTIIWTSSNTDVAVVSDKGVVSPVADGEAEITVSFGGITSDPVAVTITTPICGSPFTAPSGETYTTANYNNTGLTNLCWTTSNLQEAGQSATCYSNNCDTYSGRGYYYTFENAKTACGALTDSNGTWRLPTTTEWKSLISAYPNLAGGEGTFGSSADLKLLWGAPELRNGHYCPAVYGWGYIDGNGYWWGSTANTETVVTNSTGILWYGPDSRVATQWDQVRCVRDI